MLKRRVAGLLTAAVFAALVGLPTTASATTAASSAASTSSADTAQPAGVPRNAKIIHITSVSQLPRPTSSLEPPQLAARKLATSPTAFAAEAAAAPTVYTLTPSFGQLVNGAGRQCLDADLNTVFQTVSKVQLWRCEGPVAVQQTWYYVSIPQYPGWYFVHNALNGRCLEVNDPGGTNPIQNGSVLQTDTCGNVVTFAQIFTFVSNAGNQPAQLRVAQVLGDNSAPGCVQADPNTIHANGTVVQSWACSDIGATTPQQQWTTGWSYILPGPAPS